MLALSGCEILLPSNYPESDIESLTESHQYKRLQQQLLLDRKEHQSRINKLDNRRKKLDPAKIESIKKLDEQLADQRKQLASIDSLLAKIPNDSATHQRKVLEELAVLRSAGEWQQAATKLSTLESQVPDNSELSGFRSAFDRQRQRVISRLEDDILMLESEQLPQRVSLYRALAQAGYGDASIYARLQSENDQRKRTISSLRDRARIAEQEGQLSTALKYVKALSKLDDSEAVQADLARLNNWLNSQTQPVAAVKKSAPKRTNRFDAAYRDAIDNQDLLKARSLLNAELKRSPNSKKLITHDDYLNEIFAQRVNEAKEDGEQKYTEGEIEAALGLWENALPYAPNDVDLLTNVQRAKKILNKLETLKSENEGQSSEKNNNIQ